MKLLTITGNVGYDATIKEYNGNSFLSFTVAVNERYKKSTGEVVETTDWVNCTTPYLSLQKYLKKGTRVACVGHMKQNVFKSRDGEFRAGLNLRAFQIDFLGGNRSTSSSQAEQNNDATVADAGSYNSENEPDDLPF